MVTSREQMYPDTKLFIDGSWRDGTSGKVEPILNPATGKLIGTVAHASIPDLDDALESAVRGSNCGGGRLPSSDTIDAWGCRKARERAASIARIMTLEQGKPLGEAKMEVLLGADIIDWFAEEARRSYGRTIPSRSGAVQQVVIREPVGPVAAFTPWNFPINQAVRKISAAMAAGCSVIPEGTRRNAGKLCSSGQCLCRCRLALRCPQSRFRCAVRHIGILDCPPCHSQDFVHGFDASRKRLAALAGSHMKRVTMELGGHAPALVFEDADVKQAAKLLSAAKFRNAGQVCVSPTRFMVMNGSTTTSLNNSPLLPKLVVGDGLDEATQMGPLANLRRVEAMDALVSDAVQRGAHPDRWKAPAQRWLLLSTDGSDGRASGLAHYERGAIRPCCANRVVLDIRGCHGRSESAPYGLAAYAYTKSAATIGALGSIVESGMVSINHQGLALPETPSRNQGLRIRFGRWYRSDGRVSQH
jgi:succinate-semialdehyde dehydrogenase/glutarate-semialdehyde dehydrogenase